jgi:hypothetical protein
MALDTLQIPATIINNDKLVSMYGNLLAKKKSEEDAYQKGLIDQMAKIDSTGIKREDLDDYKKLYEDYVSFGTNNLKNLSDPNVQVKLKQQENQLKGFITLSKANKEEDIKLMSYLSPDYDDNTRKSAQSFIATKTLDRSGGFDYTKTAKADTTDYITKWVIDPKEIIIKGNTRYTNPVDAYPTILKNIEDNVNAKITTVDGMKALAQHAVRANFDLSKPEEKQKAIKSLAQTLFDINKVNFDKAITDFGTPTSKETESEETKRLGYSSKNVPAMQFIADTSVQIAKGDAKALEKLKQMSLGELKYTDKGETIDIYKIDPSTTNPVLVQTLDRRLGSSDFSQQVASFLNKFGMDSGIKQVGLGEYRNFLLKHGDKYYKTNLAIKGTPAYDAAKRIEAARAKNKPATKTTTTKKVKNTRGI